MISMICNKGNISFWLQDQKALFNCNDNEGHTGQFVYIRDDRKDKEYFGLCEVEVFEHKGKIRQRFTLPTHNKGLEIAADAVCII